MDRAVADTIPLTIEFTNLARQIAGVKEIQRGFPAGSTYADVIEWLASSYPDMVGILIQENQRAFTNSTMFIINNEMELPAMILEEVPQAGNRLTIVSIPTGG